MKRALYLLGLTIILQNISGCHLSGGKINHLWFYTYSDGAPDARDSLLTPASFLECQKDGSYSCDFGHFEYGVWRLEGNKLYLTDNQHRITVYTVDMSKPKEMQLLIKEGHKASFESQPLPDRKDGKDPFSLDNNRWRIHAAHKESDIDIRRRLYEHCRFWETYFAWALDTEVSAIDVRATPTNLKIYGNGFALKPLDQLPAAWKTYFFDEADCARANAVIADIFRSHAIAWPHSDNRYKQFIGAFQQMENYLK